MMDRQLGQLGAVAAFDGIKQLESDPNYVIKQLESDPNYVKRQAAGWAFHKRIGICPPILPSFRKGG